MRFSAGSAGVIAVGFMRQGTAVQLGLRLREKLAAVAGLRKSVGVFNWVEAGATERCLR